MYCFRKPFAFLSLWILLIPNLLHLVWDETRWLWQWNSVTVLQRRQLWEAAGPGKVCGWADGHQTSANQLLLLLPPAPGGSSQLRSCRAPGELPACTPTHCSVMLFSVNFHLWIQDISCSDFFSFLLPGVTGPWMRSKYICNNRQLSGKYKRRYLKLSGHAVRLKHCWQ